VWLECRYVNVEHSLSVPVASADWASHVEVRRMIGQVIVDEASNKKEVSRVN